MPVVSPLNPFQPKQAAIELLGGIQIIHIERGFENGFRCRGFWQHGCRLSAAAGPVTFCRAR